MSFSPREAVRKISCLIFEISPREAKFSRKLNRTLEETAQLIASRCLARQFAQLFPQVCGRLKATWKKLAVSEKGEQVEVEAWGRGGGETMVFS